MGKSYHSAHRLLAFLLILAIVLPMTVHMVPVSAAQTITATNSWDFEEASQLADFSLYQSGTNGFSIAEGLLTPDGSYGEMKALLNTKISGLKSVSVDIVPGETGVNAGVYLGASEAGNALDQINALAFLVESNRTDANRIDVITGSFPTWTEHVRMISDAEHDNALFSNDVKKPVNLKLNFDDDNITVTLSLAEDSTVYTQSVYYCDTSKLVGQIGLRAYGSDVSFDNLCIDYEQEIDQSLFEGLTFTGMNTPVAQTDTTIAQIPNTIEMWVKMNPRTNSDSAKYRQALISCINPNGSGSSAAGDFVLFSGTDGSIWWYEVTDKTVEDTSSTAKYEWKRLSPGTYWNSEWTHLALTRQEGCIDLYVNGEKVNTWEKEIAGYSAVPTQPITFGYSALASGVTQNNLDGSIGDVRLWSDVRTQEEIQQDMYKVAEGTEDGLMHCWNFDEQSGSIFKDSVENGVNGTFEPIVSVTKEGGLEFKGTNETLVTMESPASHIPQVVELWVKIDEDSDADQETLIAAYSGKTQAGAKSGDWYLGTTASGKLRWVEKNANGQSGQMNGSTSIKTGEWTHVAVVRYEGDIKFYINGQEDTVTKNANVKYITLDTEKTQSSTIPALGYCIYNTGSFTNYLDGAVKGIRLWNVDRTQTQIRENMNTELTGTEEGLMHYWKLDALSDNISLDQTGSGNDITVPNGGGTWSCQTEQEEKPAGVTNVGMNNSAATEWRTVSNVNERIKTVEAWVKVPTAIGNNRRLTVISAYPHQNFHMDIYTNGRPRLWFPNASGSGAHFIASVDVRTNQWTHIAWVIDESAGTATCYINGESVYTSANAGQSPEVTKLYVAHDDRSGWQYPFMGKVADIRLWNKTLTAEEVKYSMDTETIGVQEGLVLNLPLDEGDNAGKYRDLSGNDNTVMNVPDGIVWLDVEKQPSDYSIAIIPDQQYMTASYVDKLNGMYQWIADNVEAENMQMVINLGDITDNFSQTHWDRAKAAYNLIDGKVPYILVPGNHDYDYTKSYRDLTAMNQNFPLSMFKAMDTYGGSYSEDNGLVNDVANTWQEFTVNGNQYLVLALEFCPRDAILEWANKVVADHPNHQVIVFTHGYVDYDGTFLEGDDSFAASAYKFVASETEPPNDAAMMWDKFVRKHKNIIMVLSGHIFASTDVVVKTDIGDHGNEVKQFLIDAQSLDSKLGGVGMVAMMNFSNNGQDVEFTYYSTSAGKYMNVENQFTFELPAQTQRLAKIGTVYYETVMDAVSAADGQIVEILASSDEAITIGADITIDLAGNTLFDVTVAEGAVLTLIDTASDNYTGQYGSAAVAGTVASFAEVEGKTYLAVSENGVYSAHCYDVALTHISLDPSNDALGYKAKLYGDAIVQSHVQNFGFNLWVDGGQVKTYGKTGTDVLTLRLKNILKNNGGEMHINATAFVTLAVGENTTKLTCGQYTTTMKHTLQMVDEAWSSYAEAQQTAVKTLCDAYYDVVCGWQLYNIYPELDDTAVLPEAYDAISGSVLSATHNGFAVQNGQLMAVGASGEGKVILTETPSGDKTVSVDIYPVSGNLINSGIYLGATNAADAQDSINALTVFVESIVESNPDRIDIVIGNFPAWKQYHRTVIESDAALFTDGVKEPVNLQVDISGNDLTVTLSLISDPSKSATVTYTYNGAYDLSAGLVGLRSQYDDSAFDNFTVMSSQETVTYTFDDGADVSELEFYYSGRTDGVMASSDNTLALHQTASFTNGTLAADLNTNGNNTAGIVFGADITGESYYLYRLTADRFVELVKVQEGFQTVLDRGYLSTGHIDSDFNRLEVVKDGNTIYCYYYNRFDKVNCYAVYQDPSPLTGEYVGVWSETPGTKFRNVTVSRNLNIRKAKMLIFGHSYTEMWSDYESYFPEYIDMDNIGIGGSAAIHWEALADEVIVYEPELGIYNIGINDLTGGTAPKAVINSVEKALLDIKTALPEFKVVLVSVSHCPARTAIAAKISETNALMRNLAASYDWIYYAEAEYLFCTEDNDPLGADASLFIDGLHPSSNGYQLMSDVIRSAIKGDNQPVFDEGLVQAQFEAAKNSMLSSLSVYSQEAYDAQSWVIAEPYYAAASNKVQACTTEKELEMLDLSEEIVALSAIPNKAVDVVTNILNADTRDALNVGGWTKTDDNTVNISGYSYALDTTSLNSEMQVVFKACNNTGDLATGGVFLRARASENDGVKGYLINYVSKLNYMQVYYLDNVYNSDGSAYVLTYLGGIEFGTYGDVIGTEFHAKIEGDKLYLSTMERHNAGEEALTVVDLTHNGDYAVYESGYFGVLSWNNGVSFDLNLKHFLGNVKTDTSVACVDGTYFDTVADALAAANGSVVEILCDLDEAITVSNNTILDLAGCTLSNVSVAEGISLKLIDSATEDDTGTFGSAIVTGEVEAVSVVGEKRYLTVCENNVYSAHFYDLEISKITVDPEKDALRYQVILSADVVLLSKVTDFGLNLWNDTEQIATYSQTNSGTITYLLEGILAGGNGETEIHAKATAVLATGQEEISVESAQVTTSMKQLVEEMNNSWNRFSKEQKTVIQEYVNKYADAMASWNIDKIISWTAEDNDLKILTVGNSFSVDSMEYFYQIAQDVGVENIVLGDLYIGACSLDTHLANLRSGNAAYTYYQNYTGTWTTVEKHTMQAAIESEEWDYICFQHSNVGWDPNSYASLDDLIDGIAELCPDAKFVWNMYWAYPNDSDHHAFPNYGGTQESMYNMILERTQDLIAPNERISIVIPAGTAIQNARSSFLGDTLNRDNCHLNDIGKYIAGITWVEAITGIDTSNLQYCPAIITEDVKAVAIESVHNAMAKPYEVTPSKLTKTPKYLVVKGDASVMSYDGEEDTIHINMANSATRNQAQLFDEEGNVVGGECFAVTGRVKMDNTATSGSAASKIEFQVASGNQYVKFLVYRYEVGSQKNNSINLLVSDPGNNKTESGFIKDNGDGTFSTVTSRPNNLTSGVPYETDYMMIYENGTVYFVLEGKLMYRYTGAFDDLQYYFGVTQYADVTYTNTEVIYDAEEVATLADPFRA